MQGSIRYGVSVANICRYLRIDIYMSYIDILIKLKHFLPIFAADLVTALADGGGPLCKTPCYVWLNLNLLMHFASTEASARSTAILGQAPWDQLYGM
jgi:hypothetical protein